MAIENSRFVRWPKKMRSTPNRQNSDKYCYFHKDHGHDTEDCFQLKDMIERLIQQGYLQHFKEQGEPVHRQDPLAESSKEIHKSLQPEVAGGYQINTIQGPPITFDQVDLHGLDPEHNNPMVITMDVANFAVQKVLVDSGNSVDLISLSVLRKMDLGIMSIKQVGTPLTGFGYHEVVSLGTIDLPTSLGEEPCRKTFMIKYLVVEAHFAYNIILGRPGLNLFQAVVSTFHLK
ncbi:hypothetical protein DH2020_025402 [Rehmannia glutinosa]|uniref:Uncharacterized protein n=1 Tax=Rehmannia glutinosa TaxID=99300 RepID=A0ABR0W005_REHGL